MDNGYCQIEGRLEGNYRRHRPYPNERVMRSGALTKEEFLRMPAGTVFCRCHERLDGHVTRTEGVLVEFQEERYVYGVDTEYGVQVWTSHFSDAGMEPYDIQGSWNPVNWIEAVDTPLRTPPRRPPRPKPRPRPEPVELPWQEVGF